MMNTRLAGENIAPITVLQLLPELEGGGVERGTLEIGKFLVSEGHNSLVVSDGGRLVPQLEQEGSKHVAMPVGKKTPACLMCVLKLRNLMLHEKVDILHLRSRLPAWVGYLAWLSLPKVKRPVMITTFHGFYSVSKYSSIMTKGDIVIAVSQSIRAHIQENYKRSEGVKTIFRGVDGDIFNPENMSKERVEALRSKWGVRKGSPVIMLPGRFSRWKGQDVFLQSLTQLTGYSFQAILVGDTEDNPRITAHLQEIIQKHNLGECVKMVGHCEDMPAGYLLADIIVSASSTEPEAFGRVSIEGMAMGKPVIATAHGGSLETVVPGQTGWLVQPADDVDMARAIREALSLPEGDLAAIGKKGRARVLEHFTNKSMCEQTVGVYHHCLQER